MAYSVKLDERLTNLLKTTTGIVKKKMFGGVCYMMKDKMFCGIVKDELMVRCLDEKYESMLKKIHVRQMDFTGRPMKGFLFIDAAGIKTDIQLYKWIDTGIEFALKSPPKKKKAKK